MTPQFGPTCVYCGHRHLRLRHGRIVCWCELTTQEQQDIEHKQKQREEAK